MIVGICLRGSGRAWRGRENWVLEFTLKTIAKNQELSDSLLYIFIFEYTELQELSIPLDRSHIEHLKAVIMPRTKL